MSDRVVPKDLEVESVLSVDAENKGAAVLAHVRGAPETKAVVVLSKEGFTEQTALGLISAASTIEETQRNDKYSKHRAAVPSAESNAVSVIQICPATPSDIAKYERQKRAIVRETADLYTRVTLPWVATRPVSETAWVLNLVAQPRPEGVREKIIFEDDDFVLCTDTKWTGTDVSEMYALAIVRARHGSRLRSLRDLRGTVGDAALLRAIAGRSEKALLSTYGVRRHEYRAFLHYVPSFWHLHVHFVSVSSASSCGDNVSSGRALLIEDVIDALDANPDHFSTASISMALNSNHGLYRALQTAGVIPQQ